MSVLCIYCCFQYWYHAVCVFCRDCQVICQGSSFQHIRRKPISLCSRLISVRCKYRSFDFL